ncbi:L-threonate dehydrogenase [Roseicitreum antarcticum]|uniref:L-threonate dehydrogenase n=1 Tax=Roseicitreum antarcticum TaxID=564137 RepID=A0A1H2U0Z6_9RHOB|nr:L-threonate dehydrogenase [Roseicitreum antarcticum]SDW49638.1 2-hydroxy-3-oxopropionate reductase [Roseicitreum antarcticum]
MTQRPCTGIFGLGSMGYGMAQSLLRAGHDVVAFDIASDPVARIIAEGAVSGALDTLVPTLDCAVVVVLNAAQTEAVIMGSPQTPGLIGQMRKGSTIVACATVAPDEARRLADIVTNAGLNYLDAPISGGAVKAAAGKLSIMASGSEAAFTGARPVLDAMAEVVFEMGAEPGQGSAIKAVNQMLVGIQIAAMAEAMTFGLSQGISTARTYEVITRCAGNSWAFENRGQHVVDGNYAPASAIDIWPKDLGIVLDAARSARFSAPLTATALQQFLAASGSGLGREDDAAVAKVYARNAGLALPGDPA